MKEKSIGNNLQETLNREDNKEDVFQAFLQNNNICLKPLLFVNLFFICSVTFSLLYFKHYKIRQ